MKDENWTEKEKRELFCKAFNSLAMTLKEVNDKSVVKYLAISKKVVDTAFSNYPPIPEEQETSFQFGKK